MIEGMLRVFEVLREADEVELEFSVLAADARLSKWHTAASLRDLCRSGLVRTRREGRTRFVSLNQRPVR